MSNYPIMSQIEESKAPWNQKENPKKKIEVTISVTLSKTVRIEVSDYTITDSGKDEDGNYFETIDYSDCNLEEEVENQIYLPQEAGKIISEAVYRGIPVNLAQAEDLSNWNVDEFECIIENDK